MRLQSEMFFDCSDPLKQVVDFLGETRKIPHRAIEGFELAIYVGDLLLDVRQPAIQSVEAGIHFVEAFVYALKLVNDDACEPFHVGFCHTIAL